jgi:hypothetical protein
VLRVLHHINPLPGPLGASWGPERSAQMTKRSMARAAVAECECRMRLAAINETLAYIKGQYSDEQKARAAPLIADLQAQRNALAAWLNPPKEAA